MKVRIRVGWRIGGLFPNAGIAVKYVTQQQFDDGVKLIEPVRAWLTRIGLDGSRLVLEKS